MSLLSIFYNSHSSFSVCLLYFCYLNFNSAFFLETEKANMWSQKHLVVFSKRVIIEKLQLYLSNINFSMIQVNFSLYDFQIFIV